MKRLMLTLAALALFSTAFSGQVQAAHRSGGGHGHHSAHHRAGGHRGFHGNHRNWSRVSWSTRYGCNVYYSAQANCWYRFNPACGCYVRIVTGPVCP